MSPLDWNTLTILGAVGGCAGAGVLWLESRFRRLEKTLYREMDKHRREDDAQFKDHSTRIQRVELQTFGFTRSP